VTSLGAGTNFFTDVVAVPGRVFTPIRTASPKTPKQWHVNPIAKQGHGRRIVFSSHSLGSSGYPWPSFRSGQIISHLRATSVSSHESTTSGRERSTK
jgi:hypothetical protein